MNSDSVLLKLLIGFSVVNSIVCYENAYDLLEKRNKKRYDEVQFGHEHSKFPNYWDNERHLIYNKNPYVYTTMRPYFNDFGNGYDNLGNGIPFGHFQPHRRGQENWPFDWRGFPDPPQTRHFGFRDHSHSRNPHRYNIYPEFYQHQPKYERQFVRVRNEPGLRRTNDFFKTDRYLEDNEDKNRRTNEEKTDEIFQRSHEGLMKDSLRKENTGERSHSDQSGENKSSIRSNKVVKKGYSTKGFASHHHKDETGNSTTFFDESSDFGGQSDFKDFADGFGNIQTSEQVKQSGDEKFYKESGGQNGKYGSGLSVGNQKHEKDSSSSDHHVNEELEFHKGQHEGPGHTKNYHYLNGEKFDFVQTQPEYYY